MGRPTADDPRDKMISLRFTESEFESVEEWVGSRNRSELLRKLILEAAANRA